MTLRCLLALPLLLTSCVHRDNPPVSLDQTNMFDLGTVQAALASHNGDSLQWEKALVKAEQFYRVTDKYTKAEDSITAIICRAPSVHAYYELGSAYLADKHYEPAVNALTIAAKLHAANLPVVFYKLAATYAYLRTGTADRNVHPEWDSLTFYDMMVSLQMGYAHPENFNKNPAFADLRTYYLFRQVYNDAMDGRRDPVATRWKEFKTGFAQLRLPFTIDSAWVQKVQFTADKEIFGDYETYVPEMLSDEFSRDESQEYYFVGKVREDSTYIAVIYASRYPDEGGGSDSSSSDVTLPQMQLYLTTYSQQGRILGKVQIAGNQGDSLFRFCTVSPALDITILDKSNSGGASAIRRYRITSQGKVESAQSVSPTSVAFAH